MCGDFVWFVAFTVRQRQSLSRSVGVKTKLQNVDTAFQKKILPLFDRNCLVCHGSTVQRAGLDLRTNSLHCGAVPTVL